MSKLPSVLNAGRARWALALASTAGALALAAAAMPAAAAAASTAPAPAAPAAAHVLKAATTTSHLHMAGHVNLGALAKKYAGAPRSAGHATRHESAPLRKLPAAGAAAVPAASAIRAKTTKITHRNVRGEHGFIGITGPENAAVNQIIGDVSPPDQGLAVGPISGRHGRTVAAEFVNDSLNVTTTRGHTIVGVLPASAIFGLPSYTFLSDPRAYYDPASGHWFFTMFDIAGLGVPGQPAPSSSEQYIAVSTSRHLLGNYTVFSIDTTDAAYTAGGCPCFGDYDQVGADRNGFYITTNQFSINGPNFNGTVLYAVSKGGLISAARGGAAPILETYTVPYSGPQADPFAGYHLSPSTVTQGAYAPSTEYFVESNANLPNNPAVTSKGLEVFALLHTGRLNHGQAPKLVETPVKTERYSEPPNAVQKAGYVYRGSPEGKLMTDFNAVQEVTYARGKLYGEFSTGLRHGSGYRSGVDWFVLKTRARAKSIRLWMKGQGYVKTSQNLLYPVIGVNSHGKGYLAMALSGKSYYPSAAYMKFDGTRGPRGRVRIAARGSSALDDFTCYPPFSSGQCRYGDYSMAQSFKGRIYMATEYVSPLPGDNLTNWATRVWSARS